MDMLAGRIIRTGITRKQSKRMTTGCRLGVCVS
jgi:hypothetical protein